MDALISIDEFAAQHQVATRTVRRWLDAGRIPGAVKVGGKWALPIDAVVQDTLPGVMVKDTDTRAVHPWAPPRQAVPTVADVLATAPVMVPLDTAAAVLGVTVSGLRRNADYFQLVRVGRQLLMPKGRIRQLDGSAA